MNNCADSLWTFQLFDKRQAQHLRCQPAGYGPAARPAACLPSRAVPAAPQPWQRADGLIEPLDERGQSWTKSRKTLAMARTAAPKPAKTRPRVKHRAARPSLPLAEQLHSRSGTPCSVPADCVELSGATAPAPADPSGLGLHATAALMANGTKRRWGWLIRPPGWLSRDPPYPKRLELLLWNLRIKTAFTIMKTELRLHCAKMALSMWITRQDNVLPFYK
jgi:hypothetical protein